jgi:hypothetical protein
VSRGGENGSGIVGVEWERERRCGVGREGDGGARVDSGDEEDYSDYAQEMKRE